MKKREKRFDAVRTMREIRDRLSERFKDMTFEEEKRYIRDHMVKSSQQGAKKESGARNRP